MNARIGLAIAAALGLVGSGGARGQGLAGGGVPYRYWSPAPPSGGVAYTLGYAFKDEPVMSINRSYLGYSNLVAPGPGLPTHANFTTPRMVPVPSHTPARRGFPWFGRRRVYSPY